MDKEQYLEVVVRQDREYQKLLAECAAAEDAYLGVIASVSPENREILERYISLCEELDHRRLVLALML